MVEMVIKNIQVIVICVNYSDFLSITYQENIKFFCSENNHKYNVSQKRFCLLKGKIMLKNHVNWKIKVRI